MPSPTLCAWVISKTPRIAPPPTTRKAITASTLISDNQNSVSANDRTEMILLMNTANPNSALHIHTGVSGNQRTIRIPAAVNSEPMATVQVSQYIQATM
ncbi:hypothetical protein D3C78_1684930 [compost metagenome]